MGVDSSTREKFTSSNRDDWETPDEELALGRSLIGLDFELDVAADATNAKAPRFFNKLDDGLAQEWDGVFWINPPYGAAEKACTSFCTKKRCTKRGWHRDADFPGTGAWVRKAAQTADKGGRGVALLPARTDTKWFHRYVLPILQGKTPGLVHFIEGRVTFVGASAGALFPSMLVVFGQPAPSSKDWIQTHPSCLKFRPLAPEVEDIHIADIARALSMQCRYAGHVERFYSVAEHSVWVAQIIFERTGSPDLAFWGLMHDASEYVLGDVTRPLKRQPIMNGYREAEKVVQAAICQRFGLPLEEPIVVTEVDTEILGTEARRLKAPVHPDWAKTTATGELPAELPLGEMGWCQGDAERAFLKWFEFLRERAAPAVVRT